MAWSAGAPVAPPRSAPVAPSRSAVLELVSNVPSAPSAPALPMALAVGYREFVLGCHSFERYLDPRYETFFVFEDEFASAWKLRELVLGVNASTSRGAHLFMLARGDGAPARELVLGELSKRATPVPELLLTANCDVAPLPPWHARSMTFSNMAQQMVTAFLADSRDRSNAGSRAEPLTTDELRGVNSVTQQPTACRKKFADASNSKNQLFSLNTLIVEDAPRSDSLSGAVHHGIDPYRFVARGGLDGWRPPHLPKGEPWLSDTSIWTEDHTCSTIQH
jgi:hypothetical protein